MDQWLTPKEQEVIMWALSRCFDEAYRMKEISLPVCVESKDEYVQIIFELIDKNKVSK